MNLVFLLKNELVLLNQRPKVSFVLCCLVVDVWWGPREQGVSAEPGSREPLPSRAASASGCLARSPVDAVADSGV